MATEPIDTGGSAFPSHGSMGEVAQEGMSVRDYFAAAALNGMLQNLHVQGSLDESLHRNARAAYLIADAMIAERNRHD